MNSILNTAFQAPGTTEISRFEKIHNLDFKDAKVASKAVATEIAMLIKQSKKKVVLGLATGTLTASPTFTEATEPEILPRV